jgi:CRISPR system Cascade subunit CasC
MGGTQRMRISSQSLKRAWRTSDLFEDALAGHKGIRSKEMGVQIRKAILTGKPLSEHIKDPDMKIIESDMDKKDLSFATDLAFDIARVFVDKIGKDEDEESDKAADVDEENDDTNSEPEVDDKKTGKKTGKKAKKSNLNKKTLKSEQIVFYTPEDIKNIQYLIDKKTMTTDEDLKNLISNECSGADVAMFGRMLANAPGKNVEAAVQVAHAITVHTVAIEDDYFTAVDDLNRGEVDAGSAHLGEAEFSAGLFYSYICINNDLLKKNLGFIDNPQNDTDKNRKKDAQDIAQKSIGALITAAAKIAPSGKQNSFASRVRTSYILAEKGDDQPRSLSVAYLKAINGKDFQKEAIHNLLMTAFEMDAAFGDTTTQRMAFIGNRTEIINQIDEKDILKSFKEKLQSVKHGTLSDIITFVKE